MTAVRQKEEGWLTRARARAIVFALLAAIVAVLCWLVVEPVIESIAWAVAFAVVSYPLYAWLARRTGRPSLAAGLVTLLVTLLLCVRTALIGHQVAKEAIAAATTARDAVKDGSWQTKIERNPAIRATFGWVGGVVNLKEQLGQFSEYVPKAVQKVVTGSLALASGTAIAMLLLFFFLRDRELMLKGLRSVLPLSKEEDAVVFTRVANTLHAIFFGTLVVSMVQGTLGGLMFWFLGLPAPVLWGCAMAVFAIVPMVGTAFIWGPAAIYLFLEGDPGKAMLLTAWGVLVVGTIDNLLQPLIVEEKLRIHLVLVFISIVGGLYAFGATGLIVGPAVLAIALALLDIWRARVAEQRV